MKGALGFDPRAVVGAPPRPAEVPPGTIPRNAPSSAASAASAAASRCDPRSILPLAFVAAMADAPTLITVSCSGVEVVVMRRADGRGMATKRTLLDAALPALPAALRARIEERLGRADGSVGARSRAD